MGVRETRSDILSKLLWKKYSGPKKDHFHDSQVNNLLGAGVFGDGLGTFRDGMFGQFTGQQKPDGSLDLPGGDG